MKNIMLFCTALFVVGLFFTTRAYSATCGFQLVGRNTNNHEIKFDVHIRKYQGNAAVNLTAVEPGPWVKLQTYTIPRGSEFTKTVTTTLCDYYTSRYEIKLTHRRGTSGSTGYDWTNNKGVMTTRFVSPEADNSSVEYVGDILYYIRSDEAEDNMQ